MFTNAMYLSQKIGKIGLRTGFVRCISSDVQEIKSEFRKYGQGSVDLEIDHQKSIATIKLSNANVKNAVSPNMMSQFHDISLELAKWQKEQIFDKT